MSKTARFLIASLCVHLLGWGSFLLFLQHSFSPPQKEPVRISMSALNYTVKEVSTIQSSPEPEMPQETPKLSLPEPRKSAVPKSAVPKKQTIAPQAFAQKEDTTAQHVEASVPETPPETAPLPAPTKQSYLDLHQSEILQALQNAKEYPELARKRSIEGTVELSFTITPEGDVIEVSGVSHSQILSSSAIQSLHRAKAFFPKSKEFVTIKVPIIYRLK